MKIINISPVYANKEEERKRGEQVLRAIALNLEENRLKREREALENARERTKDKCD